jgi:hypothetical protein
MFPSVHTKCHSLPLPAIAAMVLPQIYTIQHAKAGALHAAMLRLDHAAHQAQYAKNPLAQALHQPAQFLQSLSVIVVK